MVSLFWSDYNIVKLHSPQSAIHWIYLIYLKMDVFDKETLKSVPYLKSWGETFRMPLTANGMFHIYHDSTKTLLSFNMKCSGERMHFRLKNIDTMGRPFKSFSLRGKDILGPMAWYDDIAGHRALVLYEGPNNKVLRPLLPQFNMSFLITENGLHPYETLGKDINWCISFVDTKDAKFTEE
jgi:hypothetical protein